MSNEEFASQLRVIPFPFAKVDPGTSVEIFHGAHGMFETKRAGPHASPCSTSAASPTCWPPTPARRWCKFPLSDLKPGSKIKGTTVAELGNRNRPLDMIVYKKDGKDYLLMANSARGVMKVDVENIDKTNGIISPIKGTAGLPYETIAELKGVNQLDKLDKDHALVLRQTDTGSLNLQAIQLP